jgi:hypothetical protein
MIRGKRVATKTAMQTAVGFQTFEWQQTLPSFLESKGRGLSIKRSFIFKNKLKILMQIKWF